VILHWLPYYEANSLKWMENLNARAADEQLHEALGERELVTAVIAST